MALTERLTALIVNGFQWAYGRFFVLWEIPYDSINAGLYYSIVN